MFLCITYENGVRMCLLKIYQLYMYTVNLEYLLTPFIKLYTALTFAYKIHFFLSTESFITNPNLFQYKSINFKNYGKFCLEIGKKLKFKNAIVVSMEKHYSRVDLIKLKKICLVPFMFLVININLWKFFLTIEKFTYENGVRICLLKIYQLYVYTVNLKYLLTPFMKLYTALSLAYKIYFFLSTESFITNQNLFQYKSINFKNYDKFCLEIGKKTKMYK